MTMSEQDFPPQHPATLPGSIWGVTTYFNSARYAGKLRNFRLFRESLRSQGLPLVAVELVHDDAPFELGDDEAEILVRRRGGAVLWQKERLLNIALDHLPAGCDKIVCLDADVLFVNGNWVADTAARLEQYAFVQPFSSASRLPRECTSLQACGEQSLHVTPSAACHWAHSGGRFDGQPGFAVAARRSILQDHGVYDRMIVGGADRAILSAAMGFDPDDVPWLNTFPANLLADLRAWSRRIHAAARGSVFYTEGKLLHLWHGALADRMYYRRVHLLDDFDVREDIRLDGQGLWSWSSNKPALHEAVRRYFLVRNEDGQPRSHRRERWKLSLKAALRLLNPSHLARVCGWRRR